VLRPGSKEVLSWISNYNVGLQSDFLYLRYGDLSVRHPLEKARKVMVLLNKEANGGKVKELFKKNALPLLHLSGLDVDIVEVKSAEEMQSLGKVMDTQDADCVYLVGGDGTLMRYISGIFDERQDDDDGRRRAVQTPPLGVTYGREYTE